MDLSCTSMSIVYLMVFVMSVMSWWWGVGVMGVRCGLSGWGGGGGGGGGVVAPFWGGEGGELCTTDQYGRPAVSAASLSTLLLTTI